MRARRPLYIQRGHTRACSSLVQLVIVMSIASVLMSLTGVALHRLFRQEVSLVEAVADTATWHRLSHDIRRDAHHAGSAVFEKPASELRFELSDGGVLWTVVGNELHRRRLQSDSGKVQPSDVYRFTDATIQFASESSAESAEVRRKTGRPDNQLPVRLSAAVGLNQRVAIRAGAPQVPTSE